MIVTLGKLILCLSILVSVSVLPARAESLLSNGKVNDLVALAVLEISKPESERNVEVAIKSFEAAANKGSAYAKHSLGLIYTEGIGVEKDREKAFSFFSDGAKSNFPPSQNQLANLYMDGYPNPNRTFFNYRQAVKLYEKAANAGYKYAEYNLGNAYRTGKGKTKNLSLAHSWFRKSAEQGVSESMYFLGFSYEIGAAGTRDRNLARYWYCKASSQRLELATWVLNSRYSGLRSCNTASMSVEPEEDSSDLERRLSALHKQSRAPTISQKQRALAKSNPASFQKQGEQQLEKSFAKIFKFLGEFAAEAVTAAVAGAIVYKISEELDLDPSTFDQPINRQSYSDPSKSNRLEFNSYRYSAGASITSKSCSCQCVNGEMAALCRSSVDVPPICVGVCPVSAPLPRPPQTSRPPLPGTSSCRQEQVYNYALRNYQWRQVCR